MFDKSTIRTMQVVSGKTVRSMAAGLCLGIAALGLAGIASTAYTAPITIPAGLSPGEQYRLAFVTSTTRDATSSDIADYNAFVLARAISQIELLNLGTTWTAIASTRDDDARDNTGTNPGSSTGVKIFPLDGTKIADSNAALWDGAIVAPLNVDETGSLVSSAFQVWTGSQTDGTASSAALGTTSFTSSIFGSLATSSSAWIIANVDDNDRSFRLYGLSGLLTVAAIPEPGALILFSAGLAFCAFTRRRTRNGMPLLTNPPSPDRHLPNRPSA